MFESQEQYMAALDSGDEKALLLEQMEGAVDSFGGTVEKISMANSWNVSLDKVDAVFDEPDVGGDGYPNVDDYFSE